LGDPAALNRAVGNLLDNAIKFTPAGGVVSVALTREGASACLRVADTGRGVAPEDVPHVFERFHRARDAASIPGSGLGLAIVKAIVEAHHGEVTLSSNGPGTRVEMQLPAAD
jgi:two-component system sensor histidine kinase MprB